MNTPASARRATTTTRSQLGWLLVLAIAIVGVLLAVLEIGLWLVFASGALATWAAVGLFQARSDAPVSSIRHAETGWAYMRTELARSRRHDRRFCLIGIPEEVWLPPGGEPAERDEIGLAVATTVQRFLRRPDRAWVDGGRLRIVLTESDRERGLAFLARARATLPQIFGDERVRLVVFPDDGITSDALLTSLDGISPDVDSRRTQATAA